ncbi:MAG: sugar ABC transporter substrate-binding protein [Candidatus Hydrogenedentales bacterium]
MKQNTLSYFLVACLAIGLCGCLAPVPVATQSAASRPKPLEVYGWNIAAASLKELAPGFEAEHPEIPVHVNVSGANLQTRFMLSLAAGVGAPDISQLQRREVPRYSRTGRLADLTDWVAPYRNEFPESLWKDCMFEGRIYGIPWDIGPCAVFYKRSLFTRYGVDPDSIETWDDFIVAGQQIVERSGGRTKMLFHPSGSQEVLFEMLIRQAGGQVFDDDGRIAINSPETAKVLRILQRFVETGIGANTQYWSHAFYSSLNTETVATYPMAVWFGGFMRDFAPKTEGDWGVFPLPAFEPGGLRTSTLGGSALVIPEQCTRKEAAWKYIEAMLCTKEAQLIQFRDFDLFPALTTTYSDPFFDEPVPLFGGQHARRLFTQDIDKILPFNYTKDWMEAIAYIQQSLSRWASSGMEDPEAFLADLEVRMSQRLVREISPNSLSRRSARLDARAGEDG